MALKDECTSKTLLLYFLLPQCDTFVSGTIRKSPLAVQPLLLSVGAVLCPSARHPASLPGPFTSLSARELCAHISTAPTQVVAILEKSREDISPCMEHLLEVPHWLTAITGVSEVKGVMSNWGLFHFRDARSCLLVHPMERSNLQAFSKRFIIDGVFFLPQRYYQCL